MKRVLDILFGSLQALLLTLAVTVAVLVGTLYVAVHSRLAGMAVEHGLNTILAEQLGTRVTLDEDIEVSWNNQLVINHLTIYDQQDVPMIYARRAMIAFELWPLLQNHLVLNTCQLIDFDIQTYRQSADSALNCQFLFDAFSHKDESNSNLIQQLDFNFIVLRQGSLSYDVIDKPSLSDSPIDPNHVKIERLSANVHVHDKELLIKKLRCTEHDNTYHVKRVELTLDFMDKLRHADDAAEMLISVNGLEMSGEDMLVNADLKGTTKKLELQLHEFALPHGHPKLKDIDELRAEAAITISQLSRPIDSLFVTAQITDLELQTWQYGQLQLSGQAEGSSHQASVTATLTSNYGSAALQTDIERNDRQQLILNGRCQSDGLDLAQFLPSKAQVGTTAANLDYHAIIDSKKKWTLNLSGIVNRLEWRGHNYHDIELDCNGNDKWLRGNIALADSLGDIGLTFDVNLNGAQRHLLVDGRIAHLAPNALNISDLPQTDSIRFTSGIHAEISGQQLRNLQADVKLTDFTLDKGDHTLQLGDFDFEGTPYNGRLNSSVAKMLYNRKRNNGQYSVQAKLATANDLLSMLNIPVTMSNDIRFEARLDSSYNVKHAYLKVPEIQINQENHLSATLTVKDSANGILRNTLELQAYNANHQMHGTVRGRLSTAPLMLTLDPTSFVYNNEQIQLDGARMLRNEKGDYIVQDVHLKGGQQEVSASGVLSKDGDKDFVLSLSNFDLGQIFNNLERQYVHFGGRVTGDIMLSSRPEPTLLADELKIEHFTYIDTLLGDAKLSLEYCLPRDLIEVTCDVVSPTKTPTHIDCEVDMGDVSSLDLRVHPDQLPLGFINYWVGDILQEFSGTITGDVRLYGPTSGLQLEGSPFVDGRFTHNILGTYFHLKDRVHLRPNLIHLDDAMVDDLHGHSLTLDAKITHDCLQDFGYQIGLDMSKSPQGFLVLDRPKALGRMYWGQIYARGKAQMEGGNGKHRIDVDFSTADKSWIFVSPGVQDLSPDQEAYSFLTFRDKAQLDASQLLVQIADTVHLAIPQDEEDSHTDLEVKLIANATEQCEVTVQMDPSSEDLLTSRGNGTLTIIYNPQRDLTLTGEYRINQGTYTMNVNPDVINKRFQLQNTSMVSFNGVPSEANIRLDATYNIPSVNLADLGEQVTALKSLSRTTVPIDCKMNVSGQLASPQIEFDLEVKNGNKEVDDLVHNAIGTPEMINQQVLYLLIFSKFYPPQDVQSQSQMRAGAELSSLASASIASQLNQLLNRLSDNLTLGTSFKSDRGDFTDMEMDLSLSTRLLNDRLLLYGNLGYRDPANRIGAMGNSSSFIGDFDIEYIINAARTVRAKVYSHYNERDYSINNALTTQGVGLIVRHDFDTFSQIWQRRNWFSRKSQPAADGAAMPSATSEKAE